MSGGAYLFPYVIGQRISSLQNSTNSLMQCITMQLHKLLLVCLNLNNLIETSLRIYLTDSTELYESLTRLYIIQ